MPRELIPGLMPEGDDKQEVVEVAWGRADIDHRGRQLSEGSVAVSINVLTGEAGAPRFPCPDVLLDRRHLNTLIRALRRARDQALGADA